VCIGDKGANPSDMVVRFFRRQQAMEQIMFDRSHKNSFFVHFPLAPIALLDKNKLLLQGRNSWGHRVIYDLHDKSYDLLFDPSTGYAVYYYQSLFSA